MTPLAFLPEKLLKPVFFIALALTVICFAIFQGLDTPMRTSAAPSGVVSFELAGSAPAAGAMVASWDPRARLNAAFGLGFDFLFMPVYATALSAGVCLAAKRRRGAKWSAVGLFLAWGAFGAILFDATENIALFAILGGNLGINPQIAFWCASFKFALIVAGLVYGLAGWLLPQK